MKRWRYVVLATWPDGSERPVLYCGRFWTRRGAAVAAECHAEVIRDRDGPPFRFEVERVPAYL